MNHSIVQTCFLITVLALAGCGSGDGDGGEDIGGSDALDAGDAGGQFDADAFSDVTDDTAGQDDVGDADSDPEEDTDGDTASADVDDASDTDGDADASIADADAFDVGDGASDVSDDAADTRDAGEDTADGEDAADADASPSDIGSDVSDASDTSDAGDATLMCDVGEWDHDEDNTTACVPWSDCLPGFVVDDPTPSATQDRVCAPCPEGTTSYETNATSCVDPICGNELLEEGEDCDAVPQTTCAFEGYGAGDARCDPATCTHDLSGCTEPLIVDVGFAAAAGGAISLCGMYADGSLICSASAAISRVPIEDTEGGWTSIAGGHDELCATRADGTIRCWVLNAMNEYEPQEVAALEDGSGVFAPDDGDAIVMRAGDGRSLWMRTGADAGFRRLDVVDADLTVFERAGGGSEAPLSYELCAAERDGAVRCYQDTFGVADGDRLVLDPDAAILTVAEGGPWIDVGRNGDHICAVRDGDYAVGCWLIGGDGTLATDLLAPASARELRGVGQQLLFTHRDGRTEVVTESRVAGLDSIPQSTRSVVMRDEGESAGSWCWAATDGSVDCNSTNAPYAHAPRGDGWVDVELGGSTHIWIDDLGRTLSPQVRGAPDLSIADDITGVNGQGAHCGIVDSEIVCTGASSLLDIPDVPVRAFATAGPIPFTQPLCVIGADDGRLTCTSYGGVLDDVPDIEATAISVGADSRTSSERRQWAIAIDNGEGALHCWGGGSGDDPCANVPTGTGFIHVELQNSLGRALRDDGTAVVWDHDREPMERAGQAFDRYVGSIGIGDDGTIGYWTSPDREVPDGTFIDVVEYVVTVRGGDPERRALACGLRSDRTLVCWTDEGGALQTFSPWPGTYQSISGTGSILTLLADNGLTYHLGTNLPQFPVQAVATSGSDVCVLDELSQLRCTRYATVLEDPDFPSMSTFDRLVGEFGSEFGSFCAFDDGASTVCFGRGTFADLGSPPYETLSEFPLGYYCGIRRDDGRVECARPGVSNGVFLPEDEPAVQESLPSRSVSTSFFSACRVRADGELDCWGPTFGSGSPPEGPFVDAVGGLRRHYAMREDGTLAGFDAVSFAPVGGPSEAFTQIDSAYEQWCGITPGGTGICWGEIEDIRAW